MPEAEVYKVGESMVLVRDQRTGRDPDLAHFGIVLKSFTRRF